MTRREALWFINVAHFFDHYFLLIFPTAALAIAPAWSMTYAEVLLLASPLYVMFAVGTLPAGWLGDRFDRLTLIAVFFTGCGASGIAIAASAGPISLMTGLGLLGLFTAIYHPVGLALVTELGEKTGRALAINGVFGNMGLAGAAAASGLLAAWFGWQAAFVVPGLISLVVGAFLLLRRQTSDPRSQQGVAMARSAATPNVQRFPLAVLAVIFTAALFGGLVFNAVTISLPGFFSERLVGVAGDLSLIGASAGAVFAVAAFAQLPVGELLDRFGARPVLLPLLAVQIALLAALSGATGWTALVCALLLVTMLFAEIPVTTWLISRHMRSGVRSRVVSVEYLLSLCMASAAVPLIAGLHSAGLGFDIQLLLLAASAGVVLAAALFLPPDRKPREA